MIIFYTVQIPPGNLYYLGQFFLRLDFMMWMLNLLTSLIRLYFPFLNRNLQAAIGAYYDFESPNINTPSMSFVEDVTIGEGESVPPDTQFTKTWRIQNTGLCSYIFLFFIFLNKYCRKIQGRVT